MTVHEPNWSVITSSCCTITSNFPQQSPRLMEPADDYHEVLVLTAFLDSTQASKALQSTGLSLIGLCEEFAKHTRTRLQSFFVDVDCIVVSEKPFVFTVPEKTISQAWTINFKKPFQPLYRNHVKARKLQVNRHQNYVHQVYCDPVMTKAVSIFHSPSTLLGKGTGLWLLPY